VPAVVLLLLGGVLAGRAAERVRVKSDVLEGVVLRYQVTAVSDRLAEDLAGITVTNGVSGMVLDLRFARGSAEGAAVQGGYDFFATNRLPLVVLVNSQTGAGAADLAARLRSAGRALVVGGTRAVPEPDVSVAVGTETDKKYTADPYLNLTPTNGLVAGDTNADWVGYVDHTSEADLVRKKVKDGEDEGSVETPRSPVPPVVRDPALARAMDLLKALAALHPGRG